MGRFGAFRGNNNNLPSGGNNNNNNSPLPVSPLGFEEELERGFNSPGENAGGLVLNVVTLVNVLTGVNLEMNYVKRESNYIKLTEFRGTEVENPSK